MTQLTDVNTTDIAGAIRLARVTMGNVFNADDNDIPFFRTVVRPTVYMSFFHAFSESHVPGRHLNALLAAEDVLGEPADPETIAKHRRAAFYSYSGPEALPLNRTEIGGTLSRFLPHNLREGFHALAALARYRQDQEAIDLGERSIAAIHQFWDPERAWDRAALAERGITLVELEEFFKPEDRVPAASFISGIARSIGPLVRFHRATGSPAALRLAIQLKNKALKEYFWEDGSHDLFRFSLHTHSATCVLSSLAQLADLTADEQLKSRVAAFYHNGLKAISDELGWSIENCAPEANADRGEANNTGDILETALLLGKWGDPAGYEDAESILRTHLLPSQLRDISFIQDPPNPLNEDGKHDVANRHRGAFGFPAPYGHAPLDYEEVSFNMDIVGGATASLCEAHRSMVTADGDGGTTVNLLFDHETDVVKIGSPYTGEGIRIFAKQPGRVSVRLPSWADRASIEISGGLTDWKVEGNLLVINEPPVDSPITIQLPLAEREITLHHRKRDIRTRLRGDQVVAMDNFGADLTFFPPFS